MKKEPKSRRISAGHVLVVGIKKKKITGGKIQNKQKGILSGAALRDGIHHVGMKEGSLGCESYSLCW